MKGLVSTTNPQFFYLNWGIIMDMTYDKEARVLTWRVYNSDGTPMFITKYEDMSLDEAKAFALKHNYGMLDVI